MKEGFWGNYETGIWFQIDEHERWLRRGNNAEWLGVPDNVIAKFTHFADRDTLLPFVWRHAPVMRWRGHGESVTFEFYAEDWTMRRKRKSPANATHHFRMSSSGLVQSSA